MSCFCVFLSGDKQKAGLLFSNSVGGMFFIKLLLEHKPAAVKLVYVPVSSVCVPSACMNEIGQFVILFWSETF